MRIDRHILLTGILSLSVLSCTKERAFDDVAHGQPENSPSFVSTVKQKIKVFYAGFASNGSETKVYLDDNVKIHWDANDMISIFNTDTANAPFVFAGSTGDRAGGFTEYEQVADGAPIDGEKIYAVYPFKTSTSINSQGVLTFEMPEIQSYREKSFGLGANTMVCISDDEALLFKNACGYLVLNLYGSGKVTSVSLKSNEGERIAGNASIAFVGDSPVVTMGDNAGDEIILECTEPITLRDSSSPVEFWFVVPPVTFSKGFSICIGGQDGGSFEKKSIKSFTITRNSPLKITAFEVELAPGRQIVDGEEIDGGTY